MTEADIKLINLIIKSLCTKIHRDTQLSHTRVTPDVNVPLIVYVSNIVHLSYYHFHSFSHIVQP